MNDGFISSGLLFAKQVEIFVPEKFAESVHLLLKQVINEVVVPMSCETKTWMSPCSEKNICFRETVADKNQWENIINGYSTYNTAGCFRGDKEHVENTVVFKLIITNYATHGLNLPVLNMATHSIFPIEPFATITNQIPFQVGINLSREDIIVEYTVQMFHHFDIIKHIYGQLHKEIMNSEEEIWIQVWATELKRLVNPSRQNKIPIVLTQTEKQEKFGAKSREVMCVMDYMNKATLSKIRELYGNDNTQ